MSHLFTFFCLTEAMKAWKGDDNVGLWKIGWWTNKLSNERQTNGRKRKLIIKVNKGGNWRWKLRLNLRIEFALESSVLRNNWLTSYFHTFVLLSFTPTVGSISKPRLATFQGNPGNMLWSKRKNVLPAKVVSQEFSFRLLPSLVLALATGKKALRHASRTTLYGWRLKVAHTCLPHKNGAHKSDFSRTSIFLPTRICFFFVTFSSSI